MNWNQSAKYRQSVLERRTLKGVLLLAVGVGSLFLMTAQQAVADEVELDQTLFGGHAVESLEDERLAGIRGKFVVDDIEVNAVILWDERPGGSGQGGSGTENQAGNSAQGFGNQQATRVTMQRSRSSWQQPSKQ